MNYEGQKRKLSDNCFNYFWKNFEKEFEKKIEPIRSIICEPQMIASKLGDRFKLLSSNFQRNQDYLSARELYNFMKVANKFLKHL